MFARSAADTDIALAAYEVTMKIVRVGSGAGPDAFAAVEEVIYILHILSVYQYTHL